ncbi:MAG: carboxyl transferase domain-containing protein [SAR324 cluster bacterium]|jgi:acetyl-CoA carboxylase carboxyltransferase component|nr:acetyl-CoA carboxylase carboxyltransferase subunit [Deltaproteobacteria bacterium]MDP6092046.1 carboxyl transferase domain-containing protein [SAR324 cluster bacterium]MDP6247192.1 carboxyl transferase domain-containing protein [SAR324 cluster bacterium]MDP6463687.1 carboxyl transferase domain-containing protein [SAR324 cluster bacterium]MDP6638380.1 carboxyl transferase domain-containing protein [SAR324 cluster bacterium]|tara:strand:+ start:47079 stop:48737 length:1659 start_codon:yes stop_codon:yes gene_type:complete
MTQYSLKNPFAEKDPSSHMNGNIPETPSRYHEMLERGKELLELPKKGGGESRVQIQHGKGRMTVWERIKVLTDKEPHITFQNWGAQLDGAGIVTGIMNIKGRDVALYGHDFTVRAGSMDATNGAKLARQILMAGEHGIPLIGMNDSAGAFVPAGVGGLDGYSEAFQAMRKISGVVPSIMLMFGYNAGGGAYLPRQGSFLIQPNDTFFGLTGPDVVREALGEDITPDQLGGPRVHSQSGVVDVSAEDELGALRTALRLLSYLPNNNRELAPFVETSLDLEGFVEEEAILLRKTFAESSSGFNTPLDMRLLLQQMVDYGDYFELQPDRGKQLITAFGRMGGSVVGFLANNSAFNSGNIDVDASRKGKKFMRFCNLFNTPVIFLEDVSGYAPGSEQERAGIVQAGRELLDSIIDLRVPRLTLIVRNAFGGAYCAWNSYHIGADFVFALPTSRISVMGPAGRQYVYKEEYRNIMKQYRDDIDSGKDKSDAVTQRDQALEGLTERYERELLNPEEALKLGSVSSLVMPGYSRQVLGSSLHYLLRHYQPSPLAGPQRE